MSFRLESVELGADAEGKITTAPVVVQAEVVPDGFSLKGQSANVFESLERAIEANGVCPPDGSRGFPDGVAMVTRDRWQARYYADAREKDPNVTEDTLRKRFARAIDELVKIKKISTSGQWFWLGSRTKPDMSGH
jgi:hypothetical protein